MTSTAEQRISQAVGSGSGEASDKLPFSGPPESAPGARSFSGLLCASCPASLAPGDGQVACFRCLGADHTAAAMAPSVSCVACRELPEEGVFSRHLYFSPAVDLADTIDLFRARPDYHDGVIDADDAVSIDDVFDDSASGVSRSRVSTATAVERERPRRMADLFGDIMGEAAAIKGIPMPAPPLAPISDDMQGECFRTPSSSRRVTQCPLFPPVQHFFSAAGGDPSTLKAPVKSYTDFTNVEGWADTQARGIPRLEPPLAALLCPGAGWLPNEKPLPPDRLQKQIPGGCRVAVGRHVHMASGSPASKKRRPLEPRGWIRDSLHEPVDTAACTGLLVPHNKGEETGPRAVATACGQRMGIGLASLGFLKKNLHATPLAVRRAEEDEGVFMNNKLEILCSLDPPGGTGSLLDSQSQRGTASPPPGSSHDPSARRPTTPRARTRWKKAAPAGEQCFGNKTPKVANNGRKYTRFKPAAAMCRISSCILF
ncbi:unnamed protein product [Boreogadus saida]